MCRAVRMSICALRSRAKKLVMVLYFAPWCPNWQYEAPVAQRLYEKYKKDGFEIIGVSEYGSTDEVKKGLTDLKVTFPVVVESDSKTLKEKTTHYDYRKLTGDTRSWGSPWNIFIEPALVKKDGDVIAAKSSVVNGELIEADVEFFIRTKLGLGPEDKKTATMNVDTKTTEVCEDKPLSNLVKP